MYRVLAGVRIIEVAAFTFVPSGGALCADWGADVIKVEHPAGGDPQRGMFTASLGPDSPDVLIQQPNRGKRSIAINLSTDAGRELLYRLVADADVFLTNFLTPARRRLRIDVDDIRAVNPRIIYARGSGQGVRGPDAEKGGFDLASAWARSGMGYRLSEGADEPIRFPPALVDLQGGLALTAGIAGALFHRERTGEATVVDVSLFAMGAWDMSPDIVASRYSGEVLPSRPRADANNPLVNSYATADGRWLYLVLLQSDPLWDDFCQHIGRTDLIDDPRFRDSACRQENRIECIAELDRVFGSQTLDEWRRDFSTLVGVWAPLQSPLDVRSDPQTAPNGILTEVNDGERSFELVSGPVQFDEENLSGVRPAPDLGADGDQILLDMGLTWDEIIELKLADVIQ